MTAASKLLGHCAADVPGLPPQRVLIGLRGFWPWSCPLLRSTSSYVWARYGRRFPNGRWRYEGAFPAVVRR